MSTRTALNVTDQERAELKRLVRRPGTPHGLATRCKVILLDERGLTYAAIGAGCRGRATLWERGPREAAVDIGATLIDGRALGVTLRSQSLPSPHGTSE